MTKFIRHPHGIPISYSLLDKELPSTAQNYLADVNGGGLCFNSAVPLDLGKLIRMKIQVNAEPFEAEAIVVWCNKMNSSQQYEVGVRFLAENTDFNLRMAEQVCEIEQYKEKVLQKEHRQLSSEEAAAEWIQKHARHYLQ